MNRNTLYSLLLSSAVAAASAAVAQQTDAPAPAPSGTPPASQPAPDKPAGPSADLVKKAKNLGMRPKTLKNGQTAYCWKDADVGTRFETEKCVDENNLQAQVEQRQATIDQLHRGMTGAQGK